MVVSSIPLRKPLSIKNGQADPLQLDPFFVSVQLEAEHNRSEYALEKGVFVERVLDSCCKLIKAICGTNLNNLKAKCKPKLRNELKDLELNLLCSVTESN